MRQDWPKLQGSTHTMKLHAMASFLRMRAPAISPRQKPVPGFQIVQVVELFRHH